MCIDLVSSFGKLLFLPPTRLLAFGTYFVASRNQIYATTSSLSSCEMRTSAGNKHVPAFLTKLWKLVGDPDCNDLISWSESGNSFVIHNDVQFAKELLPMYFKHNHMASFVRQLNMYGFRKLNHIEYGGMHYTSNEIEFYHQYFIKGQESLLKMIKRKVSNSKISEVQESKSGSMKDVALSIKDIKDHQQTTEKMVKDLKQQNEILWKQLAVVNDRCVKQQRLLTELLPLFFDMVQPNSSLSYKRKAPLMIDDGLAVKKFSRLSPQYLNRQNVSSSGADAMPSSPFSISNSGPVIHDVTEMETKKPYADEISRSPEMPKESEVFVDSPLSCKLGNSEQMADSPFAEHEVMEPFNLLNFRGNVTKQDDAAHEQSLRSQCMPFHIGMPDAKPSATKHFSPFNSLSTTGSPSLDGSCSPAVALSDGSCHSEFCGSDKPVPAMKTVLDSVSDQNSILSSRLISDTCLSSTAGVATPNKKPFSVVANPARPSLLQSPVSTNHVNTFPDSSNIGSESFAACSTVTSIDDNSHRSENLSNGNKIKCDSNGSQNGSVQSMLASGNFHENVEGIDATSLGWLATSENTPETNIDNWLGQLFRSEGIVTGCELEMVLLISVVWESGESWSL